MGKTRLFLKLDTTEHCLLNLTKKELQASSYKELILTLIDGDYIDYLCNASLTEKALRKILVNLNQIKVGYFGDGDIESLIEEIEGITSELVSWNNKQLAPLFDIKGPVHEVQIRLSDKEKSKVSLVKAGTGFRTYGDLITHLCYSYLGYKNNLPLPLDYAFFDSVGIEINNEAKAYNTHKSFNENNLNNNLEMLYELVLDLKHNLSLLGGNNVSEH